MVILTLTEKGGEAKQLTFEKDEVTVGRVQGNDIVLPKGNVSKRHCRIYVQQGAFSVEDMKSTNGTYVNGRKIGESTSVNGADKIYVGDFIIKIENAPGAGAISVPPANEAGSLSTAIPRRAPTPPPPPARSSGVFRAETEAREPSARPTGSRATLPPPPPPPPTIRRDSKVDEPLPEPPTPDLPGSSDIDLEDEPLAARPPKLTVPPLRSRLSSLSDDDDNIAAASPSTGKNERGQLPPPKGANARDLATWLEQTLAADGTTALFVAGPAGIEVERNGRRESLSPLESDAPLAEALRTLAAQDNPGLAPQAPIVDVYLGDGSRLTAALPPLASQPSAALRRATTPGARLGDLVSSGTTSNEMKETLEAALGTRRNVLVSGDGLGGKAVATVLAAALPAGFRIVALAEGVTPPEGAAASWVSLTSDRGNPQILATAAALAPDYLLLTVGDAVDAADAVLQAALGGTGVIAVVPARSATDALLRVSALAAPVLGGPVSGRELVQGAFDLVLHVGTLADGSPKWLELAEPKLEREGALRAEPLFFWKSNADGKGGSFGTGAPNASRLADVLAARGASLPASFRR